MNTLRFDIRGRDFKGGGLASRQVKEHLKRIGADPDVIRRVMIAAYEAEMNVVIHAYHGELEATFNDRQVDVEVSDTGPGIPDVELAMKRGWSTAPAEVRAMGFGAGLGLPNIKKNSDRFRLDTEVGRGTTVRFSIFLKPQEATVARGHSIAPVKELCRDCRDCLRICPTGAIRVRRGEPTVLDHLCIDCTNCISVCPTRALTMRGTTNLLHSLNRPLLAVPTAFLFQFGPGITVERLLNALEQLGFSDVRLAEPFEVALEQAVSRMADDGSIPRPVISPLCPAIVNLIEMRFPALLKHVAPLMSPFEAMQAQYERHSAVFVVSCPAQRTALMMGGLTARSEIIVPEMLRLALLENLALKREQLELTPLTRMHPEPSQNREGVLRVAGIKHVATVLEQLENGELDDLRVLELFSCEVGCFGSPLLLEEAYLAMHRWFTRQGLFEQPSQAVPRRRPLAPRPGLRLDEDMARAIEKLSAMDRITRTLPGKDCKVCGSPSCAAMAEDMVMGRAERGACIYIEEEEI